AAFRAGVGRFRVSHWLPGTITVRCRPLVIWYEPADGTLGPGLFGPRRDSGARIHAIAIRCRLRRNVRVCRNRMAVMAGGLRALLGGLGGGCPVACPPAAPVGFSPGLPGPPALSREEWSTVPLVLPPH